MGSGDATRHRSASWHILSFVATEVVHVCLAIPQTSNLIPKNRYNYYCGCCLVDVADSVDVAMVTVVSYY